MMVIGTFAHFQLILIDAVFFFSSCLPVFIGMQLTLTLRDIFLPRFSHILNISRFMF